MQFFPVYSLFEIEPVRGRGCHLYTAEGTRYLDLYGGHGVISIGHAHPRWVSALVEQAQALPFYSNSVQNPLHEPLLAAFERLTGLENYQLFLCNSGAEANENALKLASFRTGGRRIIAFRQGFHGRTSAALQATHNCSARAPINSGMPVEYLPLNDSRAVRQALQGGEVAAVIVEGIQGIGGVHVPAPEFLKELEKTCRQQGVPLILDEVQSGFGRSGRFFAFDYGGIQPDLITMAKGMGNGFPVAGVLIHPEFEARPGLLGTTFGGNHMALAVVTAVLETLEQEQLIAHAARMGQYLKKALSQLEGVRAVRGHGLMLGIELEQPAAAVRRHLLYEHRIFTGGASDPHVLRLLPPLCLGLAEAHHFLDSLTQTLSAHQLLSP